MSAYYGIGCLTCYEKDPTAPYESYSTDIWEGCSSGYLDDLRFLIQNHQAIATAHTALGHYVRFLWWDNFLDRGQASGIGQFMVDHHGHTLMPIDEYHRFEDECLKNHRCGDCGDQWSCRRPRGHEPPCRRTRGGPNSQ